MKNFVLTFVLTFFTFIGFVSADPWEAMTESEAKELMAFLKKNPYVFDYCDCCDEVARQYDNRKAFGHLIKIEKMEIVPCAWDESRFSFSQQSLPPEILRTANLLLPNLMKRISIATENLGLLH